MKIIVDSDEAHGDIVISLGGALSLICIYIYIYVHGPLARPPATSILSYNFFTRVN